MKQISPLANLLVLDSGVGGLSVVQEIQKTLPHCHIRYFADHAAAPYGEKADEWLIQRVCKVVEHQLSCYTPDAIIVACNTASTLCLPHLRAMTSTPVIGVVPAVKTAAQFTQNQAIGVLATPSTIQSQYLKQLISDFASHCHISKVGSSELVHMAENKLANTPVDLSILKEIIDPFLKAQCDSVVLGCTHFPLLKDELLQINDRIQWIDSGTAIAQRTLTVIQGVTSATQPLRHSFYSSADHVNQYRQYLNQMGFQDIHTVII